MRALRITFVATLFTVSLAAPSDTWAVARPFGLARGPAKAKSDDFAPQGSSWRGTRTNDTAHDSRVVTAKVKNRKDGELTVVFAEENGEHYEAVFGLDGSKMTLKSYRQVSMTAGHTFTEIQGRGEIKDDRWIIVYHWRSSGKGPKQPKNVLCEGRIDLTRDD